MKEKEEKMYADVLEAAKKEDFINACVKCEGLIDYVADEYCKEDDDNIYFSFNHIIELYVYSYYYRPEKQVMHALIPYSEYYRTYGTILMHLERSEDAKKAYDKALLWNPVDLDTLLSIGELYRQTNQLEEYLNVTKEAYRYCSTRATMARYYRNRAYYYVEKYKPQTARALYAYSNIFYKTDAAKNELQFIENAINEPTPEYNIKELQTLIKNNGIELGPDPDTLGIVYQVGKLMLEDKDYKNARDCFSIVYDSTQDAECETILNKLEEQIETTDR